MGVTVVGVRFKRAAKMYYFDPGDLADLKPGENVIVETSRGREMGRVIIEPQEVDDEEIVESSSGSAGGRPRPTACRPCATSARRPRRSSVAARWSPSTVCR